MGIIHEIEKGGCEGVIQIVREAKIVYIRFDSNINFILKFQQKKIALLSFLRFLSWIHKFPQLASSFWNTLYAFLLLLHARNGNNSFLSLLPFFFFLPTQAIASKKMPRSSFERKIRVCNFLSFFSLHIQLGVFPHPYFSSFSSSEKKKAPKGKNKKKIPWVWKHLDGIWIKTIKKILFFLFFFPSFSKREKLT